MCIFVFFSYYLSPCIFFLSFFYYPVQCFVDFNKSSSQKNVWDSEREYVMLDLLRAKFSPISPLAAELIATSGKSLAEAGKSPIFSIGLQMHHNKMEEEYAGPGTDESQK